MNKQRFSAFSISIIFFLSSCTLLSNNDPRCDDLILTNEIGQEIGKRGKPANQWTVNSSAVLKPSIDPAYPNPVLGSETQFISVITFTVPSYMRVKAVLKQPDGEIFTLNSYELGRLINDPIVAGTHKIMIDFQEAPKGCYRVEYSFSGNTSADAFGLISVE